MRNQNYFRSGSPPTLLSLLANPSQVSASVEFQRVELQVRFERDTDGNLRIPSCSFEALPLTPATFQHAVAH
ncbi:hypothetical protein STEG23_027362 [Scotinomys teguina]